MLIPKDDRSGRRSWGRPLWETAWWGRLFDSPARGSFNRSHN